MKYLSAALLLITLLTACTKNKIDCDYNACSFSAPASEVTTLENYLTSIAISATKHCSGFYYITDVAGSGSTPTICSDVSVKYKGQLTNGAIFDQATSPVIFKIDLFIESWKKALIQLKPGGKMRLWTPPSLAYGSTDRRDNNGNIVIPANSILYFEIELVAVL